MTEAPEWALQAGVHAALLADAGVQALLGDPPRVHDEPPESAVFPYVTFGRAQAVPADGDATPTTEHVLHLHVWSRYGGRREAKRVIDALRSALHDATIALTDHQLVNLRVTFTDVFRPVDGRTSQGVVRLRAVTEPA